MTRPLTDDLAWTSRVSIDRSVCGLRRRLGVGADRAGTTHTADDGKAFSDAMAFPDASSLFHRRLDVTRGRAGPPHARQDGGAAVDRERVSGGDDEGALGDCTVDLVQNVVRARGHVV